MAIKTIELLGWKDQATSEAIAWHRAVNKMPEARLTDFGAGFSQGYLAAISDIKRHGGVVETDRVERARRFCIE